MRAPIEPTRGSAAVPPRPARRTVRRVVVGVLIVTLLGASAGGCAGRKGRNDDNPRPGEYKVQPAPAGLSCSDRGCWTLPGG